MNNDQWDFSFDDILGDFGIGDGASEAFGDEAPAEVPAPAQTEPEPELSEEDIFFRDFGGGEIKEKTVEEPAEVTPDEPSDVPFAEPFDEPAEVISDEPGQLPEQLPEEPPEELPAPSRHIDTSKEDAARAERERKAAARRKQAAARENQKRRIAAAKNRERNERLADRDRARAEREREKELASETKRQEKKAKLAATVHERRQLKIALIVFAIVIGAVVTALVVAGRSVTYSGKNFPNVYVNNIFVGNMDREQTAAALTENGWVESSSRVLKVNTFGGVSFEVNSAKTGLLMTLDEAVDAANAFGRSKGIIGNLFSYIENIFKPEDVNELNRTENFEYIDACIADGEAKLNSLLGESEFMLDRQAGQLRLVKGFDSMKLNTAELYDAIVAAVRGGQTELDFRMLSKEPVMPDFQAILTELHAEPKDAEYKDDGSFEVIDEIVGCDFSVSEAESIWQAAAPGESVSVPVNITWPAVTAEMLSGRLYHDLLGAMTTRYTNSTENRCSNVRLATSKIDGTILYPGDEFSYNDVVGARTEEAGFLPAPAYSGLGEDGVKDEIGGGACQVSSTLYCSTIFAFLETVERHNHIYPVNYMQLGTDATVTIPSEGGKIMDFKFRNSKNYPIRIVGYCNESEEEKTITFEIWGTLEDDDYMPVEFDNSYSWNFDYDRFIDPSYPDRPGYKIKFTYEPFGFADDLGSGTRTLTHRLVYDPDGIIVEDEILNVMISTGYALDTYYEHP